jgi:lactate dehydrogenase-like 2-hydroxyacid dehydrogenase
MKESALLINVARGHIVDEVALEQALSSGMIGGYASDVWWDYDDAMPPGYHFSMPSRLGIQRMPNVVASVDSAANTLGVKNRMIALGLESLQAFLIGAHIPRIVDPVNEY